MGRVRFRAGSSCVSNDCDRIRCRRGMNAHGRGGKIYAQIRPVIQMMHMIHPLQPVVQMVDGEGIFIRSC